MRLSIIIPAHNEEENIAQVIERVESSVDADYELVIVNDHSRDKTPLLVEEARKRYANIRLVENNLEGGFANALRTGFRSSSGEVVIPVMGDLCDDLATIKAMLEKIDQGYDIVCGCRYIKGGRRQGGSRLKGLLSAGAGWTLYYLLGIPTHDIANAFKMYRKNVLDGIDIKAKGFEISMEIPLKGYYKGFKITEVPTVWKEREKGQSTFKIFKLLPEYLKLYFWGIFMRISGGRR